MKESFRFTKAFANTFTPRNQPNYNLRHIICIKMSLINSVYNGTESIAFLVPKVWEKVKQKQFLNAFKDALKKWSPQGTIFLRRRSFCLRFFYAVLTQCLMFIILYHFFFFFGSRKGLLLQLCI